MTDRISSAVEKVERALVGVEQTRVEAACRMIAEAKAIGVYGCGREGYQMRGFAMRLFHMGLNVGYLGETTMPALAGGAVFVVSSGPGGLATVDAHIRTVKAAGGLVILLTAQSDAATAQDADIVISVPAQTMANDGQTDERDILPMGSVYEGALFFLCEWLVAELKPLTGETAMTMRTRHTNME